VKIYYKTGNVGIT